MQLSEVRTAYEGPGPYATVYMEGRRPAEDSSQQVRLRWAELRRRLDEAGADDRTLSALDEAVLAEEAGEVQRDGRVLVSTSDGLVLDQAWDAALGAGDAAHLTDDPELGAYVRERARSTRMLVAVADQRGAVIRQVVVTDSHDIDHRGQTQVEGSDEPVHKPREGALSHKQIQRRRDEVVKQNVREVAEHIEAAARRFHPDLVVLAGEVQGRTALRDEMPPALQDAYVEVDAGGISDEGAEEALAQELRRLAAELSDQRAEARSEQYRSARPHGLAVDGSTQVSRALEMGAVQAVLLEYDRSAVGESSLLAAAARSDADADLVDPPVADGVAAILRFDPFASASP